MTDYTEKGDYNFDYQRVVAAFALVYSASIILPLLLFFLVVCMGMKMTLQNSCKSNLKLSLKYRFFNFQ